VNKILSKYKGEYVKVSMNTIDIVEDDGPMPVIDVETGTLVEYDDEWIWLRYPKYMVTRNFYEASEIMIPINKVKKIEKLGNKIYKRDRIQFLEWYKDRDKYLEDIVEEEEKHTDKKDKYDRDRIEVG